MISKTLLFLIKTAPRIWQVALMTAFVLSCFGVLLYLWLAFGGSSPLQPQGYSFHVNFPEATQLAQQADARAGPLRPLQVPSSVLM